MKCVRFADGTCPYVNEVSEAALGRFLKLHLEGSLDLRNSFYKLVQPSRTPAIQQKCQSFIAPCLRNVLPKNSKRTNKLSFFKHNFIILSILCKYIYIYIYEYVYISNLLSVISYLPLFLSIVLVLLFIYYSFNYYALLFIRRYSSHYAPFSEFIFLNTYHRSLWLCCRHFKTLHCMLVWCLFNTTYVYVTAK